MQMAHTVNDAAVGRPEIIKLTRVAAAGNTFNAHSEYAGGPPTGTSALLSRLHQQIQLLLERLP